MSRGVLPCYELAGQPGGVEGLVVGVFASLAVFATTPSARPEEAPTQAD